MPIQNSTSTRTRPGVRPVSLRESKLAHSIPSAVECSSFSRSYIYTAIKKGKLKARKAGRRTVIEDSELRRFIAALPELGATT